MIIAGTHRDLSKLAHMPLPIQQDAAYTIAILDNMYDCTRDIIHDLGGFVGIVDNKEDLKELLSDWKIDFVNDVSEFTVKIEGYEKKLFILNPDFAIVIYTKEELL